MRDFTLPFGSSTFERTKKSVSAVGKETKSRLDTLYTRHRLKKLVFMHSVATASNYTERHYSVKQYSVKQLIQIQHYSVKQLIVIA